MFSRKMMTIYNVEISMMSSSFIFINSVKEYCRYSDG